MLGFSFGDLINENMLFDTLVTYFYGSSEYCCYLKDSFGYDVVWETADDWNWRSLWSLSTNDLLLDFVT